MSSSASSQPSSHWKSALGQAALLLAIWSAASALLSLARVAHPAFGMQGDLPVHYHLVRAFARCAAEGDWLPRWAGLLDGGRGDAIFTFYPPLAYLLSAAVMKLLAVDVLTSLKIVSVLTLILAQANAYLFARCFFYRRRSLLASLCYVLLPAYPLIALHRGFFANAVALGFAPLSLLGAHLLLTGERRARATAIFALGTSAVILSHTITTYLCGVSIGLMVLLYLPRTGWRGPARLALASLLVFALTAFFLVPQRIEMNWTRAGMQLIEQDYRNYFLFAGARDNSQYRQQWAELNRVFSFITLSQTLTAALLAWACRPVLFSRERSAAPARAGLAFAAFGLLISLPVSELLWRHLPGLKYIQFPWRFQPFVSLGCGMLAAAAIEGKQSLGWLARLVLSAMLTWTAGAALLFTVLLVRIDEPGVTRAQVAATLNAAGLAPVSVAEGQQLLNQDELKFAAYAANQIYFRPKSAELALYPPAEEPGGLSFITGRGHVTAHRLQSTRREFTLRNEEPVRVRIETYHYPHWVARLDRQEIAIDVEQAKGPDEGLMLLDLPAGVHQLVLNFEVRNRLEQIAGVLSLVSWVLLLGWIGWKASAKVRASRS